MSQFRVLGESGVTQPYLIVLESALSGRTPVEKATVLAKNDVEYLFVLCESLDWLYLGRSQRFREWLRRRHRRTVRRSDRGNRPHEEMPRQVRPGNPRQVPPALQILTASARADLT